jgi:hypothetical protein
LARRSTAARLGGSGRLRSAASVVVSSARAPAQDRGWLPGGVAAAPCVPAEQVLGQRQGQAEQGDAEVGEHRQQRPADQTVQRLLARRLCHRCAIRSAAAEGADEPALDHRRGAVDNERQGQRAVRCNVVHYSVHTLQQASGRDC